MGAQAEATTDAKNSFPRINCSPDPQIIPGSGLKAYNHDPSDGIVTLDPEKIQLLPMSRKMNGNGLNDNVCRYLSKHPDQIPHSCRGRKIFFPKTTFPDEYGIEVFRCLTVREDGQCVTELHPVSGPFGKKDVALSLI